MPAHGLHSRAADAAVLATVVAWLAWLLLAAPAAIVALATVPIAAWAVAGLVLARHSGLPAAALGAAFLWGAAAAAPLSGWVNDALRTRPDVAAGAAAAGGFAAAVAPLVEEASKGLVLLFLPLLAQRPGASPVLAGIALGAASGLGFAATENVAYLTIAIFQGGLPGLLQAAWMRGVVSGVKHAVFTACIGAGAGSALGERTRGRAVGMAALGLAAAVLLHGAWNTLAAPLVHEVVCDAPAPGAACAPAAGPVRLLVIAPLAVIAALAPGGAALFLAARRARRTATPSREEAAAAGGSR